MATGDLTVFEEFADDLGEGVFTLSAGLTFGIINNTAAPTAADATPAWGDYSANQIGTGGGYTGPVALTGITYTEAGGVATLQANSFTISQNASGQSSTTAWGIIYDDDVTTPRADPALAYVELGTIDITAGDLVIKFNNVASGSPGTILTVTVA